LNVGLQSVVLILKISYNSLLVGQRPPLVTQKLHCVDLRTKSVTAAFQNQKYIIFSVASLYLIPHPCYITFNIPFNKLLGKL